MSNYSIEDGYMEVCDHPEWWTDKWGYEHNVRYCVVCGLPSNIPTKTDVSETTIEYIWLDKVWA